MSGPMLPMMGVALGASLLGGLANGGGGGGAGAMPGGSPMGGMTNPAGMSGQPIGAIGSSIANSAMNPTTAAPQNPFLQGATGAGAANLSGVGNMYLQFLTAQKLQNQRLRQGFPAGIHSTPSSAMPGQVGLLPPTSFALPQFQG